MCTVSRDQKTTTKKKQGERPKYKIKYTFHYHYLQTTQRQGFDAAPDIHEFKTMLN